MGILILKICGRKIVFIGGISWKSIHHLVFIKEVALFYIKIKHRGAIRMNRVSV